MTRLVLPLAAILTAFGLGFIFEHSRVSGQAEAERIALLRHTIHTTDSIYVHDTLRLSRAVPVYLGQRDTLLVHIHDTVSVLRFIAAADSTVAVCRVVVESCEARVAARDSLIAAQSKLLKAKTGFWSRFGVTAGVGAVATPTGEVKAGIAVVAGIRIFP